MSARPATQRRRSSESDWLPETWTEFVVMHVVGLIAVFLFLAALKYVAENSLEWVRLWVDWMNQKYPGNY